MYFGLVVSCMHAFVIGQNVYAVVSVLHMSLAGEMQHLELVMRWGWNWSMKGIHCDMY